MANEVLVVGTGTIGLPLIGLLVRHRDRLGIDRVLFNKNTPLKHDSAQIRELVRHGAELVTDEWKFEAFAELGLRPSMRKAEALGRASVVIDCTPCGNKNKEDLYSGLGGPVGFIAQGSEKGFGKPYALDINDGALVPEDRFVQVVSCNTHNIASLVKTLGFDGEASAMSKGTFLCMRRANDISQGGGFVASPEVGRHSDGKYGTHHARDAHDLFETMGYDLGLWSSAVKLNTQYMHAIWFQIERMPGSGLSLDEAVSRLRGNPKIAMTYKSSSNKVFSFGRDQGYYGRLLNQTVVASESLAVDGDAVVGFCFTPQDGNSLLSSVAATLRFLHPDDYASKLSCMDPYLFDEV